MENYYDVAKEEMSLYGPDCTSFQNMLAVLIGGKADPSITGQLAALGAKRLVSMGKEELISYPGIGEISANRILSAFGIATYLRKYEKDEQYIVRSPEDAANYLEDMSILPQEHFDVLYLSTKNQLISRKNIFRGTLNSSIVHPRDVYREAFRVNAASIVVAHNHPSGDPTPSREDIEVTKRLKDVGETMGVDLLDHVIIGSNGRFKSLKELGYF